MDAPSYYPCRLRLNGRDRYVVYRSDNVDGFLRTSDDQLVVTDTAEQLAEACHALGVQLEDEPAAGYDFDHIRGWCKSPSCGGVDCNAFLNSWNFLDDLAGFYAGADTPFTRLSREWSGVNETLFWGNNLPAVTPPGEHFVPRWSAEALDGMREVFVPRWSAEALDGMREVFEAGITMLEMELGERPA